MTIGHDGLLLVVRLVVLPHIIRSPVMSTTLFIYVVHFEFEFTHGSPFEVNN
jgi:hypothetical protein